LKPGWRQGFSGGGSSNLADRRHAEPERHQRAHILAQLAAHLASGVEHVIAKRYEYFHRLESVAVSWNGVTMKVSSETVTVWG